MTHNTDLLGNLKNEFLGDAGGISKNPLRAVSASATDFATLPDYEIVQVIRNYYASSKQRNPYFLPRSGFISSEVEVESGDERHITFSGYNYLGLSQDERVVGAATAALQRYGTHAGAARMVGGEIGLHQELERELADFCGHDDCVAAVGGYISNLAVIGHLMGKRDLILHDEYMHNSGVLGGVLSQARRISFPHNDFAALESLLAENRDRYERAMILLEGAYSMDGDLVDLPRAIELKRKYGCWLMLDEAHSYGTVGATGRGVCEHYGVDPRAVDISMGTLSKSLASCGGFIAGNQVLIDTLRHFTPGLLLYSTGLSPANTGAALGALRVLREEPQRVQRLQENARCCVALARERGLETGSSSGTPIVPVMIGDGMVAMRLMSELLEQGVIVHAVMYPVVPRDQARLRLFITAEHTRDQLARALDLVAASLTVEPVS